MNCPSKRWKKIRFPSHNCRKEKGCEGHNRQQPVLDGFGLVEWGPSMEWFLETLNRKAWLKAIEYGEPPHDFP